METKKSKIFKTISSIILLPVAIRPIVYWFNHFELTVIQLLKECWQWYAGFLIICLLLSFIIVKFKIYE